MKTKILLVATLFLLCQEALGQTKLRKMPPNINHPAINNYAPYISIDGNAMVYLADVAEDHAITMNYTVRDGVNWRDPVIMPKTVNNHLNFPKGYGLSADGKTLYFTNTRSNGMGGFDLYTSQLKGSGWGDPVNMLLPANSKSNEGCPSVSADGSMMFFMRCEKMDFTKADACKILMMKKKSNGQWEDPVELPAYINTGNSQTPRILGDGETLTFSSNKFQPSKGGMDLYFTRLSGGKWSNPQPLDFANTANDDQYVSATSAGRYLMRDAPGQHSNELIEILFPAEARPRGAMKIEGIVTGPDNPSSAFVSVFNTKVQSREFSAKPEKDGAFVVYIKEGGVYDLSVEPEKDDFTFFSKAFNLTGDKIPLLEKVSVTLKPAAPGDEIALEGISFHPNSSEISPTSSQELRRLTRLITGNPDKSFSVLVTLAGYVKDSLRSSADLTEVIADTVRIPVTYNVDSVTVATRDSVVVKSTYHNDRTLQQAKVIGDYLIRAGIPAGRIACSGKAEPEAIPENRKTMVKVIIH